MKRARKACAAALALLLVFGTLFVPSGSLSLKADAAANAVASVDFSNGVQGNNMTFLQVSDPNNEPYSYAGNIGGQNCRIIPGGKYGYFNAADSAVPQSVRNIIVDITYYDEGTEPIGFQYNSTSNNYQIAQITKSGSNQWITASIYIDNAQFKNAQNNGCDFRIGSFSNKTNYIKDVSIRFGSADPASEPLVTGTGSSYSEFKGKSIAGYQGWFDTGSANESWTHWGGGQSKWPSVGNMTFDYYPDTSEYSSDALAQSGFANLGDGSPAVLFKSNNANVVDTHFNWMQKYGIDGVAIQRFSPSIKGHVTTSNTQAQLPVKIKQSAERTDRIFYIMYDISGAEQASFIDDIKFDWVYNIEQSYGLLNSDSYATVNGKPVVCLWGFGVSERVGTPEQCIEITNFLRSRGCYVIGGIDGAWRANSEPGQSLSNFRKAYDNFDMISPWTVGRYGDQNSYNGFVNNMILPDLTYCRQKGIDYQPVIWSGFSWGLWMENSAGPNQIPRNEGNFLWMQVKALKNAGVGQLYFAMFDEYDEGTAIMKAASDSFMVPTDQAFVTLSTDGTWLSSDFYLRLAGAAARVIKGQQALTNEVPIAHSEGPIYYRNSFESLHATYPSGNSDLKLDPCFKNPGVASQQNVSGASCAITKDASKSHTGSYTVKLTGNSSGNGSYYYHISDTSIKVTEGMTLSYWKYTGNENGKNTGIDLVFDSGATLRARSGYTDQNGAAISPATARGTVGQWQKVTCVIGKGDLIGRTIKQIQIGYEKNANGAFEAYFDDIIIEDKGGNTPVDPTEPVTEPTTEPATQPSVRGMDLIVTSVSMEPASPHTGEEINFRVEIQDIGDTRLRRTSSTVCPSSWTGSG